MSRPHLMNQGTNCCNGYLATDSSKADLRDKTKNERVRQTDTCYMLATRYFIAQSVTKKQMVTFILHLVSPTMSFRSQLNSLRKTLTDWASLGRIVSRTLRMLIIASKLF